MTGALPIVKRGGTIILAASLSEGVGKSRISAPHPRKSESERIQAADSGQRYFVMDQWQLEELAKVTSIVGEGGKPRHLGRFLRQCHVEPAASVEQALADSLREYGPAAKFAVIPKGPYVLPYVA